MTQFRNQSEETEDYGITTQFTLIGLLFVSFLLWQQWESDKAPKPAPTTVAQTEHFVPEAGQTGDILSGFRASKW
jgi:hypothetical protein